MHILSKLTLTISAFAVTSAVNAQELRYDNGVNENHVLNTGPKHFMTALGEATSGKMSMQHFFGSLQTLAEAPAGVRDGVLDMGGIAPQYTPSEFPVNSYISQLPTFASTSVAMTGANTEFFALHCGECRAEYANLNQLPLVLHSNPTYQVMLSKAGVKLENPSDIKGLRLRAGGDYFRSWIEHFGGTAVSVPGPEIYDALNSGILDGTVGVMLDVPGYGFGEQIKSVTMVNAGTWHNTSFFDVRLDLWKEMPAEQRVSLLDLAVESQAIMSVAADDEDRRVGEEFAARGIVVEPSQALIEAQAAFIQAEAARVAQIAKERDGIANAAQIAADFVALTTRWEALVKDIDPSDAKAVHALYEREIYSKLDKANFGL